MIPEKLGPYKIGRVLGRGGMGAVYEGTCESDGSAVAIKVLSDFLDEEEDAEVRLRFESEIETLKRLHHPNIVRLSGFGEEQGQLYYVMELVNGSSLQQELRKKRLFQWHEVAKIGLEICQALRHAHDRGVIHRDIKPANILLDQEGNVKLSDFGIARFFGSQQITDIHTVIGTLEYMSPEQTLAHPFNSSADLYSLGCVLYTLLIGKPPFSARSLPEILRKHKTTVPDPIRSVRYDVPDDLGYVIIDLLQIRPENRPRNALLVVKRLRSLLQALVGPPETIKVLPMLPDTPKQLHESIPLPFDAVSHAASFHQQEKDDVVDLEEMVKPTKGLTPPNEFQANSLKSADDKHSIAKLRTVTLALDHSQSPDSHELESLDRDDLLNDTTRSKSPVVFQHGEVIVSNAPTLRPAKDEPIPDVAYWSELPATKRGTTSSPSKKAAPSAPLEKIPVSSAQLPVDEETNPSSLHQETSVKPLTTPTRFVAVNDRNLDPFEEEHRTARPMLSLPMVLASTMLMIVGLTVYYLVKPTSPEVLFERITSTIRKDESSSGYSLTLLRSARKDIEDFLSWYPHHPSADQIRYYQDELDLSEHERRLERRAQFSALRSLSPVERAYVEVLTFSPNDSERMIDKLHAFIAVFQTADPLPEEAETLRSVASNPVEICVELARRRLKKLEKDVDEINAEQEQVIRRRLDGAAELDSTDPVRADAIRCGIIELYQNHRWAHELVDEAKQKLKEQ